MASVTPKFTGFSKLNQVKSKEVLRIYFTKQFKGSEKLASNQIMPLGPPALCMWTSASPQNPGINHDWGTMFIKAIHGTELLNIKFYFPSQTFVSQWLVKLLLWFTQAVWRRRAQPVDC
jgi:hypothetical protein